MAKLPRLAHVKFVKRGNKVYPYFNTGKKRDGKVVYAPLPQFSAPEFFASYAAMKAVRTKRATVEYTVTAMADEFMSSAVFKGHSVATQEQYRCQLRKISDTIGSVPVNKLTPGMVRKVLERENYGAATHNIYLTTLGALYQWGRKQEKTTLHPARDIDRREIGDHQPWPEGLLNDALSSDDGTIRLIVHLLYYTGQRIGDVCGMTWLDVASGLVEISQQKTSKTVAFPLHPKLLDELAKAPRQGKTILVNAKGGKRKVKEVRADLTAWTSARGYKVVPHGLRKNAVNSLLEAGCSYHEVSAVTGQSPQTIEHYAKRVNRKRLGTSAMGKLQKMEEGSF